MRFSAYIGGGRARGVRCRLAALTDRELPVRIAEESATLSGALEREADVLRALAHPIRLAIVDELSVAEECVCHLSHLLARPQPYISKQLAELRDAGLVLDRREGTRTYYRLGDSRVLQVLGTLRAFSGRQAPTVRHRVPGCPCPRCVDAGCCSRDEPAGR